MTTCFRSHNKFTHAALHCITRVTVQEGDYLANQGDTWQHPPEVDLYAMRTQNCAVLLTVQGLERPLNNASLLWAPLWVHHPDQGIPKGAP